MLVKPRSLLRHHAKCFCQNGFTLIEAMIVVAILAIVTALAVPSFRGIISTMNAKSAALDIVSDLTLARSEAIKRNQTVTVTPVGGSWVKGWAIVSGGITLRQHDGLADYLEIAAPDSIAFSANGRVSNSDTATENMTWSVTSKVTEGFARCVVVTTTGAARSKFGGC